MGFVPSAAVFSSSAYYLKNLKPAYKNNGNEEMTIQEMLKAIMDTKALDSFINPLVP